MMCSSLSRRGRGRELRQIFEAKRLFYFRDLPDFLVKTVATELLLFNIFKLVAHFLDPLGPSVRIARLTRPNPLKRASLPGKWCLNSSTSQPAQGEPHLASDDVTFVNCCAITKDAAICIKNSMVDSSHWAPGAEFRVLLGEGQTDGAPLWF
jgi:hypothetical protein